MATQYQLQYRINADYEWVIQAVKRAKTTHNTGMVLSLFLQGGISTIHFKKGMCERFKVMRSHFGLLRTLYSHIIIAIRAFWFYIIKSKILK
jgi:hypothetical protein